MRSVRAVYLLLGAILAAFVAMLAAIVTLTPGAAQFGHELQLVGDLNGAEQSDDPLVLLRADGGCG